MNSGKKTSALITIAGICTIMAIMVIGTIWMGQGARKDTQDAVQEVSRLYLEELAGRREQVVADNLRRRIADMNTAVDIMTDDDLQDMEHFQAFQANIKRLYDLEKFAFVDEDGLIYTSQGTQNDIDQYRFDYRTISEPEISIKNLNQADKTVIIAVPADLRFNGKKLIVCFMEIGMDQMLAGVSMDSQETDATFTNLYTTDGIALSNTILGGQSS